jgi:hypothetical protein
MADEGLDNQEGGTASPTAQSHQHGGSCACNRQLGQYSSFRFNRPDRRASESLYWILAYLVAPGFLICGLLLIGIGPGANVDESLKGDQLIQRRIPD